MSSQIPTDECDLILQGGITSGVVYPPAILELKTKYRFRGVGGASAGAIAAAVTAAAEHGRMHDTGAPGAGFDGLKKLSDDLSSPRFITDRFQSTPETYAAFEVIKGVLRALTDAGDRKGVGRALFLVRRILWAFLSTHAAVVLGATVVALVLLALPLHFGLGVRPVSHPVTCAVAGVVALTGALVFAVGWAALRTWKRVTRQLFGFCIGSQGPDATADSAALTDWLYTSMQELAGLPRSEPLTFAHLRRPPVMVDLKMTTSNLSLGQPMVLPDDGVFLYSRAELSPYFPPEVMNYLEEADPRRTLGRKNIKLEPDLRRLDLGEGLPVIVAVRMSLSFPILLSALPLRHLANADFARDWTDQTLHTHQTQRHVFSDGGIAHNFPVQMFDAWVPSRPTFGIALQDSPFSDTRAAHVSPSFMPSGERVLLPEAKDTLKVRPAFKEVASIPDFGAAILDLARSYRDRYHSALPGCRERIVRVYLGPDEGGLNLSMSQKALDDIRGYGTRAGRALLERYPTFDGAGALEHRWVRLRSLMPALEAELRGLQKYGAKVSRGGESWWDAAERSFEELIVASKQDAKGRMHGHLTDADEARLRIQLRALIAFAKTVYEAGAEPIESLNPASTVRVGRDL